jgi:N-methylhydantoinase B/oxoprolinase/acetone carboxylase alpha subunit
MSEYTEALKKGMQRVNALTQQYADALEISQHGVAAVIRGELTAARAYLQGMTDAGELRLKAQLDKETDDE